MQKNTFWDSIQLAFKVRLSKKDAIAKYNEFYDSLKLEKHKLHIDKSLELFIILKQLVDQDETFYVCTLCKVLTCTKNHCKYGHNPWNAVYLSEICTSKKFKNPEEIKYRMQDQFGQLGRFNLAKQRLTLIPFETDNTDSCSNGKWIKWRRPDRDKNKEFKSAPSQIDKEEKECVTLAKKRLLEETEAQEKNSCCPKCFKKVKEAYVEMRREKKYADELTRVFTGVATEFVGYIPKEHDKWYFKSRVHTV